MPLLTRIVTGVSRFTLWPLDGLVEITKPFGIVELNYSVIPADFNGCFVRVFIATSAVNPVRTGIT
jgi:hypothetical protein